MWSSIANLKENLNKIALDVHHDDDEEEFPIYGSSASNGGDGDVSVSDRRNSHSFAHSNSVARSPIANGIDDTRHAEVPNSLWTWFIVIDELWEGAAFCFLGVYGSVIVNQLSIVCCRISKGLYVN